MLGGQTFSRFSQPAETPRAVSQPELHPEELRLNQKSQPAEAQPSGEPPSTDFSAWDSLWIRTAQAPTSKLAISLPSRLLLPSRLR